MSKFSLSSGRRRSRRASSCALRRVERLERRRRRRVSGAVYVDRRSGIRHFQAAEVVVVACNGVGTLRLLLMSATSPTARIR